MDSVEVIDRDWITEMLAFDEYVKSLDAFFGVKYFPDLLIESGRRP